MFFAIFFAIVFGALFLAALPYLVPFFFVGAGKILEKTIPIAGPVVGLVVRVLRPIFIAAGRIARYVASRRFVCLVLAVILGGGLWLLILPVPGGWLVSMFVLWVMLRMTDRYLVNRPFDRIAEMRANKHLLTPKGLEELEQLEAYEAEDKKDEKRLLLLLAFFILATIIIVSAL